MNGSGRKTRPRPTRTGPQPLRAKRPTVARQAVGRSAGGTVAIKTRRTRVTAFDTSSPAVRRYLRRQWRKLGTAKDDPEIDAELEANLDAMNWP